MPHILERLMPYVCTRPNSSVAYYALSIFTLHNETVNIWTHLVGFLLFAVIAFRHFIVRSPELQNFQPRDDFVFGAFYVGIFIGVTILNGN